jgi:hypothetical protein
MSPAKAGKSSKPEKSSKSARKPKQKILTIEFAGIATLVWDKKRGSAEVHLVDLGSAGFERHYAALSFEVSESTPHGIKGPSADAAVSLLGRDIDIGVWNLMGTTVELFGATGKLTVDDTKVEVTKKPPKSAESIRWIADVGSLCESHAVNPLCPTASVIKLPAGRITATGAAAARKVEFANDGVPVGPDRFCLPRFKAAVPFETELAIRLSRERVLRIQDSISVTVSNTCVCGLGVGPVANHFYGHYDVVDAKRRPTVKRAGPQPMTPLFPEICWAGFVEMI